MQGLNLSSISKNHIPCLHIFLKLKISPYFHSGILTKTFLIEIKNNTP